MRPKIQFLANQYRQDIVDSFSHDVSEMPPKATEYLQDISDEEKAVRLVDMLSQRKQSIYKYLPWIVKQYVNRDFMFEDLPRVYTSLEKFHLYKQQLVIRDIGQYKHLSDLEDCVDEVVPVQSIRQQKESIKHSGAELICEDASGKIVKLETAEASQLYGYGTKWCTTSASMFESYSRRGPLFVLLGNDGRKFQFQFNTDQYMDEKDHRVKPETLKNTYSIYTKFVVGLTSAIPPAYNDPKLAVFLLHKHGDVIPTDASERLIDLVTSDAKASLDYARTVFRGPWPAGEDAIASDAEVALEYAIHIIEGKWPKGEEAIASNLNVACTYATDILKCKWDAIDIDVDAQEITNAADLQVSSGYGLYNPVLAYSLLCLDGKRWVALENSLKLDIIGNISNIIWYCRSVLKSRWYEIEPVIENDLLCGFKYERAVVEYFANRR